MEFIHLWRKMRECGAVAVEVRVFLAWRKRTFVMFV